MSSPTDFHIHHTSSKLDNPWKHNTSLKQATVQEIWLPQIYERKLVLNKAEHGQAFALLIYTHTNTRTNKVKNIGLYIQTNLQSKRVCRTWVGICLAQIYSQPHFLSL